MPGIDDLKVEFDATDLHREEILTDRRNGVIRVLVPLTPDGADDPSRPRIFSGEVQIMTQMGPIPISFDIPAADLAEAVRNYPEAARKGVRETIDRMQELRREAASKIVTPGTPGFGVPPGTSGGGIQLP